MIEPEQEKTKRKESIQNLFAFDMFCQKRFDDSLQLFAQLETGQFIFYALPEFVQWCRLSCFIKCSEKMHVP